MDEKLADLLVEKQKARANSSYFSIPRDDNGQWWSPYQTAPAKVQTTKQLSEYVNRSHRRGIATSPAIFAIRNSGAKRCLLLCQKSLQGSRTKPEATSAKSKPRCANAQRRTNCSAYQKWSKLEDGRWVLKEASSLHTGHDPPSRTPGQPTMEEAKEYFDLRQKDDAKLRTVAALANKDRENYNRLTDKEVINFVQQIARVLGVSRVIMKGSLSFIRGFIRP
jgi:hypothetical protein